MTQLVLERRAGQSRVGVSRVASAASERPVQGRPAARGVPDHVRVLRLTRRGRILIFAVLAVLVFAAFSLGRASGNAATPGGQPTSRIVVAPGQTLWSIARDVAPDRDPRRTVDELTAINHLSGPLQTGQSLLVPRR